MMRDFMRKVKKWIKSAAGKISVNLFITSVILMIIACSSWGNLNEATANNVNNILIGLATNLLGIIVTVSFVQYFLDKQDVRQQASEEKATLLRYDRIVSVLIARYVMYYNSVITPLNERNKINPLEMRKDFLFEKMCDLHETSLYLCESTFEPAIAVFYRAEESLREYMMRELENIQFKFHEDLKTILLNFVEISLANDVRGVILENTHTKMGTEGTAAFIQKCIKDPSGDWVKKADNGELGSNMMLPYVQLYKLLKAEMELVIKYKEYLEQIK